MVENVNAKASDMEEDNGRVICIANGTDTVETVFLDYKELNEQTGELEPSLPPAPTDSTYKLVAEDLNNMPVDFRDAKRNGNLVVDPNVPDVSKI